MKTLEEIERSGKNMLLPADVADYLGCDPQSIRLPGVPCRRRRPGLPMYRDRQPLSFPAGGLRPLLPGHERGGPGMNREIPDYARQILANQLAIAKALYFTISGDWSMETRRDVMTGLKLAQKGSFEMLQRCEESKEGQA